MNAECRLPLGLLWNIYIKWLAECFPSERKEYKEYLVSSSILT